MDPEAIGWLIIGTQVSIIGAAITATSFLSTLGEAEYKRRWQNCHTVDQLKQEDEVATNAAIERDGGFMGLTQRVIDYILAPGRHLAYSYLSLRGYNQ